jgi:hypothetical protein
MFKGAHLYGLVAALVGAVMLFAAPEMQLPAWVVLIIIGALGVTAGQWDAVILRRLERLEKAQATQAENAAPGRMNRGRAEPDAAADRPHD